MLSIATGWPRRPAHDRIPPVRDTLKTLRNPAIERALTELRKVVNVRAVVLTANMENPRELIACSRPREAPRHDGSKPHTQMREITGRGAKSMSQADCQRF